ncbi:MAG: hypothetical protein WCO63_15805 [Bacteroidota bacterium]
MASRFIVLLISLLFLSFVSCKHTDETNISAHFGSKSHNSGKDCMHCHKVGNDATGWFIVAGTVYDTTGSGRMPNGTIRLYTAPDGTGILRATVEVDANGNFYTTEKVDYSGGLYPEITGTTGDVHMMPSPTTNGACNTCHDGNTARRIYVW